MFAVGATYMVSRLSNNVATSMMPFYLTTVLEVGGVSSTSDAHGKTAWQIAIIPLCLYFGSTGTSFLLKKIGAKISRKILYLFGVAATIIAGLPMFFFTSSVWYLMLPFAVIYGVGFSFTLNISTAFIAAFVGGRGKSAAFVWGVVSLFDKFSSGIALFLLVNVGSLNNQLYVRFAVAGVPLFSVIAGAFSLLLIENVTEFSLRRRSRSRALSKPIISSN